MVKKWKSVILVENRTKRSLVRLSKRNEIRISIVTKVNQEACFVEVPNERFQSYLHDFFKVLMNGKIENGNECQIGGKVLPPLLSQGAQIH